MNLDFDLTEEQLQIREMVRKFAQKEIAPHVRNALKFVKVKTVDQVLHHALEPAEKPAAKPKATKAAAAKKPRGKSAPLTTHTPQ